MKHDEIGDGGSAFPFVQPKDSDGFTVFHTGMSLRDWFAGRALTGLAAIYDVGDAAKHAYAMADAMMAERVKT